MAAAALKVAIRCALGVALLSTAACDARGWHGERIEGHVGESKKKHKGTQVFELPPVSARLPCHSGSLLSWEGTGMRVERRSRKFSSPRAQRSLPLDEARR